MSQPTSPPSEYSKIRTGAASAAQSSYLFSTSTDKSKMYIYSRSSGPIPKIDAETAYLEKAKVVYRKAFALSTLDPASASAKKARDELAKYSVGAPSYKISIAIGALIDQLPRS